MNVLAQKLKEAALSVIPIVIIVLALHYTITPLAPVTLLKFLLGALCIILGLWLFLFGVDLGISPIGTLMGSAITKSNKVWFVAIASILLGFLISIAEPDLHILAGQVDAVTLGQIAKSGLVVMVSIGIAFMLALGMLRILYRIPLNVTLVVIYGIILILALFTPSGFLPISFDASGATTGALTVPFILALAMGGSSSQKDSLAAEKDSFGLVGITSTGAILAVMIMGLFTKTETITGQLPAASATANGILAPFGAALPTIALEVALALSPIVILFLIFQKILFHITKEKRREILLGILYALLGLVLFLTGVNAGFLQVGSLIGNKIAAFNHPMLLIGLGFVLGLVTLLAEPAVHALTSQIQTATSGYVKRTTVLAALSIGIGIAVALSMLRIVVPGLELWHVLLPGYVISLILSYLVPKLFVGIAFDSGGVASGPMTATFILAFAHGAADAMQGADVIADGFGIIALVALTPLITLQILGLIYQIKTKKGGIGEDGTNS